MPQWSHRALIQWSAELGRRYSSLLVAKPAAVDFGMVLLRDCGFSQRAIAKELGISRSAVRRELGLCQLSPGPNFVRDIACPTGSASDYKSSAQTQVSTRAFRLATDAADCSQRAARKQPRPLIQ